jgi:hypothetical protein
VFFCGGELDVESPLEYTLKWTGGFLRLITRGEKVMDAAEMIEKGLKENPEVRLVLDIAARARETEARELPREIVASTEVVAIPFNPQIPVSWGVLHY